MKLLIMFKYNYYIKSYNEKLHKFDELLKSTLNNSIRRLAIQQKQNILFLILKNIVSLRPY